MRRFSQMWPSARRGMGMTAGAKRMFTAGAQQSRKASGLFAFSGVAGAVVIGAGITTVTAFAAESKPKVEFKEVKEAVKKILDEAGYDDGSIGPVLVRLAWHASGTYCAPGSTVAVACAREKSGGEGECVGQRALTFTASLRTRARATRTL